MSQVASKPVKEKFIVVDDHELILSGTINVLQQQYPEVQILTAQTARTAFNLVLTAQPKLVVMDLSIPENEGESPLTNTGIQLLKTLMKNNPTLNFVVQSTHIEALMRLKSDIDAHQGGFTLADKGISSQEMLTKVEWALQGLTHTKDLRGLQAGLEIKLEWLNLLNLAFHEGLHDKEIAKKMGISERTVRNHWNKIQDALGVYPDPSKNIRIQTQIRAREEGLID